jgi:hypothetical protein
MMPSKSSTVKKAMGERMVNILLAPSRTYKKEKEKKKRNKPHPKEQHKIPVPYLERPEDLEAKEDGEPRPLRDGERGRSPSHGADILAVDRRKTAAALCPLARCVGLLLKLDDGVLVRLEGERHDSGRVSLLGEAPSAPDLELDSSQHRSTVSWQVFENTREPLQPSFCDLFSSLCENPKQEDMAMPAVGAPSRTFPGTVRSA